MDTELSIRMLNQWKNGGCDRKAQTGDDKSKPNNIVVTPRGKSTLTCKLFQHGNYHKTQSHNDIFITS